MGCERVLADDPGCVLGHCLRAIDSVRGSQRGWQGIHFAVPFTAPGVSLAGAISQQKARSFELRAALSLAKLYHSTDRPADARAVLASALNGFSPTPEFPEIAEAQMPLTMLAP
jgi:hypothetical protein